MERGVVMLLAIETSTPVSSLALWRREGPIASVRLFRPRGHAEFLIPAVHDLLRLGQASFNDVTGVAVGVGPGLFTSMRVGITTAKTIAQSLSVGIVGISSLDLLAFGVRHTDRLICACIDARRDEVFAALYRRAPGGVQRLTEPAAWRPDELAAELIARREEVLLTGDGAHVYADRFADVSELEAEAGWQRYPSADSLAELALPRFEREEFGRVNSVEPLYVRKTDAEINWEARGVTIERPLRVKIPERSRREGSA